MVKTKKITHNFSTLTTKPQTSKRTQKKAITPRAVDFHEEKTRKTSFVAKEHTPKTGFITNSTNQKMIKKEGFGVVDN